MFVAVLPIWNAAGQGAVSTATAYDGDWSIKLLCSESEPDTTGRRYNAFTSNIRVQISQGQISRQLRYPRPANQWGPAATVTEDWTGSFTENQFSITARGETNTGGSWTYRFTGRALGPLSLIGQGEQLLGVAPRALRRPCNVEFSMVNPAPNSLAGIDRQRELDAQRPRQAQNQPLPTPVQGRTGTQPPRETQLLATPPAQRAAEEQRQQAAAQRAAEEQRQREVAQRAAEEQRIQQAAAQRAAEEQRQREVVAAREAEEQRQREVAQRAAEEQRIQQAAAQRAAEEQRQREVVAAREAEEQRLRVLVEQRVAEEQRQQAAAQRAAEEQRQREVAQRAAEEQRQRDMANQREGRQSAQIQQLERSQAQDRAAGQTTARRVDRLESAVGEIVLPINERADNWILRAAAIPIQQQQFCRIIDRFHDDLEPIPFAMAHGPGSSVLFL